MTITSDVTEINASLQEEKERIDTVDSKIVSFSLAGKDYGIDIMNVKEIAKADKFTYVPNAASFVRGVYNLRGDIIPIIDLRTFFHMPVEKHTGVLENMLILRIEERVYGIIVDKIDKVVGINSEHIQPPHPIFGDINIKYISGVVEKGGDLYIILDVVRIFSQSEDEKQKTTQDAPEVSYYAQATQVQTQAQTDLKASLELTLDFIKESLPTLQNFHPSPVNDEWIRNRYVEWSSSRSGEDLQLKDQAAAEEYISTFFSPCTGRFWDDEYANQVQSLLPKLPSNNIQVWNIGCGKGYETYSFACILKLRYPEGNIKIWANDNDIMAISQAPNMIFDMDEIPEYCRDFMVKGSNGYSFNQAIKDAIVFEYHDVLNENPLPDLDFILVRDLISFLPAENQANLISSFTEKIKNHGIVITGRNENLPESNWHYAGHGNIAAFAL